MTRTFYRMTCPNCHRDRQGMLDAMKAAYPYDFSLGLDWADACEDCRRFAGFVVSKGYVRARCAGAVWATSPTGSAS